MGAVTGNPPTKDRVRSDSRRVRGAAARLKNSACREGYRFSSSCPYSSQEPVVSSKSCRAEVTKRFKVNNHPTMLHS